MRTRTALVEAGIWRSGGGAMTSGLNELQDQKLNVDVETLSITCVLTI